MDTKILVLNAGSSSLKFELFEIDSRFKVAATPQYLVGTKVPVRGNDIVGRRLRSLYEGLFDNHGKPIENFAVAVKKALALLIKKKFIKNSNEITAIGHRVVHGGEKYRKSAKITPEVITAIKKLAALAPLHNPPNLACILAAKKLFPHTRQVAVFDTAFHHTMPQKAFLYGLPYSLAQKLHIRRYGFHGISHQFVFEQARKKLGVKKTRRVITCHLGNGCSLAAIKNGKVVDTSMGFTPLEGIPMGTRTGDMDPAIIFYLRRMGMKEKTIFELVHKSSGLLGVSEISGDMRDLWAAYKRKNQKTRRALEWFCYRIAKYIGAYAIALGGLDCLVFTGGMGEKAWYLRKWIMQYVRKIARPKVLIIKTDEERKIAEETARILKQVIFRLRSA